MNLEVDLYPSAREGRDEADRLMDEATARRVRSKTLPLAEERFRIGAWAYLASTEEGEGRSLTHVAVNTATGEERRIDFTPNHEMTRASFAQAVDLGFPGRITIGPLRPDDLRLLYMAGAADQVAAWPDDGADEWQVKIRGRIVLTFPFYNDDTYRAAKASAVGAAAGIRALAERAA